MSNTSPASKPVGWEPSSIGSIVAVSVGIAMIVLVGCMREYRRKEKERFRVAARIAYDDGIYQAYSAECFNGEKVLPTGFELAQTVQLYKKLRGEDKIPPPSPALAPALQSKSKTNYNSISNQFSIGDQLPQDESRSIRVPSIVINRWEDRTEHVSAPEKCFFKPGRDDHCKDSIPLSPRFDALHTSTPKDTYIPDSRDASGVSTPSGELGHDSTSTDDCSKSYSFLLNEVSEFIKKHEAQNAPSPASNFSSTGGNDLDSPESSQGLQTPIERFHFINHASWSGLGIRVSMVDPLDDFGIYDEETEEPLPTDQLWSVAQSDLGLLSPRSCSTGTIVALTVSDCDSTAPNSP